MLTQNTSSFIFSCLGSVFLVVYTMAFLKRFSAKRDSLFRAFEMLIGDFSFSTKLSELNAKLDSLVDHSWQPSLKSVLNKKQSQVSYAEFHLLKSEVLSKGLDLKFHRRAPQRLIYSTLVFVVLSLFFGLFDLKGFSKVLSDAGTMPWTHALIDTLFRFMVAFVGIACSVVCAWKIEDAEQEAESMWDAFSAKLGQVLETVHPEKERALKIEFADDVAPVIKNIAEQLELFAEKSHSSLKKNLEEFDGALVEATTRLNSSVNQMNKHLGQVEGIIEKNAKVA